MVVAPLDLISQQLTIEMQDSTLLILAGSGRWAETESCKQKKLAAD